MTPPPRVNLSSNAWFRSLLTYDWLATPQLQRQRQRPPQPQRQHDCFLFFKQDGGSDVVSDGAVAFAVAFAVAGIDEVE